MSDNAQRASCTVPPLVRTCNAPSRPYPLWCCGFYRTGRRCLNEIGSCGHLVFKKRRNANIKNHGRDSAQGGQNER